jgi:mannose-6-phosphate isomerase-like protein (cupin superfamily)
MRDWHLSPIDQKFRLTPPAPLAEFLERRALTVETHAPVGADHQRPHTRDEGCVVVRGAGTFVRGDDHVAFRPGDFLFAPAGVAHHFGTLSDDHPAWFVFHGPEGGERE